MPSIFIHERFEQAHHAIAKESIIRKYIFNDPHLMIITVYRFELTLKIKANGERQNYLNII